MDRLIRTYLVIALVMGLGAFVYPVQAASQASFELVTPQTNIQHGSVFPVEVRIDSAGQDINAAQIVVKFNPAVFRIERVAKEQSIFTLWPQDPIVDQPAGTVTMVGGRPGGLYASHSTVATLYVTAQANGLGEILVDPEASSLAANDGAGTRVAAVGSRLEIPVSDQAATVVLSSQTHPDETIWSRQHGIDVHWDLQTGAQYSYVLTADPQAVVDENPESRVGDVTFQEPQDGVYYFFIKKHDADGTWSSVTARRFLIDSTPPAPFTIVHPDPKDIAGHNVVSWTAVDATSGVVRYEAKIGGRNLGTVTSPLALQSSWSGQALSITAIDAAGNVQAATWTVPGQARWGLLVYLGLGVMALALVVIIYLALRRRQTKRR